MTFYGHQNRIGRKRNKKPECGQKESLHIKRVEKKEREKVCCEINELID